jgi:hypothetical protein
MSRRRGSVYQVSDLKGYGILEGCARCAGNRPDVQKRLNKEQVSIYAMSKTDGAQIHGFRSTHGNTKGSWFW